MTPTLRFDTYYLRCPDCPGTGCPECHQHGPDRGWVVAACCCCGTSPLGDGEAQEDEDGRLLCRGCHEDPETVDVWARSAGGMVSSTAHHDGDR